MNSSVTFSRTSDAPPDVDRHSEESSRFSNYFKLNYNVKENADHNNDKDNNKKSIIHKNDNDKVKNNHKSENDDGANVKDVSTPHRTNDDDNIKDIDKSLSNHTGQSTVSGRRTAILLPPAIPQQHTTAATVAMIANKNRPTTIIIYPTGNYYHFKLEENICPNYLPPP